MPYVNVDLDDSYPVLLLRVWFNIPRLYPGANVEVYVSPSGVGWHVKTDYKVDNAAYIISQALLWADPVRTQYALRKLYLNPSEAHLDLMFNEKEGKCETPVPFAQILSKYAPDCNQILNNIREGKNDMADNQIKDLAKKISPELDKYHKKSFVGCITFNGVELKDDLEKVMLEIAAKDPTFRYRFYPVWWPEFEWMIAVFTDDKDLAWRKITWLKNNAYKTEKIVECPYAILKDDEGLIPPCTYGSFEGEKCEKCPDNLQEEDSHVYLLKDTDTRLFVKERKST
jgi:hypothetical protein